LTLPRGLVSPHSYNFSWRLSDLRRFRRPTLWKVRRDQIALRMSLKDAQDKPWLKDKKPRPGVFISIGSASYHFSSASSQQTRDVPTSGYNEMTPFKGYDIACSLCALLLLHHCEVRCRCRHGSFGPMTNPRSSRIPRSHSPGPFLLLLYVPHHNMFYMFVIQFNVDKKKEREEKREREKKKKKKNRLLFFFFSSFFFTSDSTSQRNQGST